MEDHADRALSAAREMVRVRLPRSDEWLDEQGMDAAGLVHYGDLPVRGRQRKLTVWLPEWDGELKTPKSGLSWLIRRKTATGAKEQIMLARSHGEVPPGPADGVVASPELRDHA
jgi:hypothetical protein